MVVKLTGKANGHEIVFTRAEGDMWISIFPFIGEYEAVIELQAYDEAGNYCFKTCYLMTFDPGSLSVSLVPVDYWLSLVQDETILCCITPVDYSLILQPDTMFLQYRSEGEELIISND